MAKRGRPKGSLNKKTIEKLVQEKEQEVSLQKADAVLTKEELPSAVDDAADVMSKYKKPLGETQKKVLDGPDTKVKTVIVLPRKAPKFHNQLGHVQPLHTTGST